MPPAGHPHTETGAIPTKLNWLTSARWFSQTLHRFALKKFPRLWTGRPGSASGVALALTLAVGSTMKTTDTPIKVLLADGVHNASAGAME